MNTIYKRVETEGDFEEFYQILIPSWLEQNYILECPLGNVCRYLVYNHNHIPVGTAEVIPYGHSGASSDIDTYFPFKDQEIIQENISSIAEIDCISIHPEHRKDKNLDRLVYTMAEHTRKSKIKYLIGIMNPMLYVALRNTYNIPIKKFGKKITRSNLGNPLYPIIIDAEYVYTHIKEYTWLYQLYELDRNLARDATYRILV